MIGRFSIGGRAGRNSIDGQSFHHPPHGLGLHGRRGGDATPAGDGHDAGELDCYLAYAGGDRDSGKVTVSGIARITTAPEASFLETVAIGEQGYVFIAASGGKGGNGGRGGDGQPGSIGVRGRNATRYRNGGDGGPGGNGGNAGNPSDGGNGGDGGVIRLSMNQRDTGLLMLIKGNLAGGDIGFAGLTGRGGRGGRGGPGGNSYHWTETRTYTDSEGNLKTQIVFRSNPGGRTGRRGRTGSMSLYRASDGRAGNAGLLRIVVVGDDGSKTEYASPYDLELVSFDVASEYEILEPDSLISIDNMVVRNRGGMPTPENYDIRVFLPSDRWLDCQGTDLILPAPVEPGQTYRFSDTGLRVRLGDFVVEDPRTRPFTLRHPVSPQARMESGIARPFRQFENGEPIHMRFPVELKAITSLHSLAPGESTRVIWAVTNVSQQTFDQKYLYRAVRSSMRLVGGDVDPSHLVFFDTEDAPHDIATKPFTKPVPELRPGQSFVIETRVGIRRQTGVVHYQGFEIGADVDLQRPKSSDRSDQYRCVDCRKVFIRVAERYVRQEESRFLLIANQKTTVNDIEKWTQLADYFGSSLDVWDVSYYGFFDLVRAVDEDESLLEQWRGMTIIIPNNYYKTPGGTTVAFNQLAKTQFLRAAADYDINFYIVGDSRIGGEAMLSAALIPVDDAKAPSQLKDQKAFLREVRRWNKYVEKSKEVVGGATADVRDLADVSLGAVHEFEMTPRTFLFQPSRGWLTQRARALQRDLSKTDPLHRWIIVHRYDTGDSDTSWGFFKKRQVGTLEVRRTLDATKGSAVLYEADSIDAIDRDFITSKVNKHGIFLALKFEDKVDRFIRLVSERTFPRYAERYVDRPLNDNEIREIGTELVDSILVDIYNEQKVARESRTWGRGVETLMPKLNYLAERSLNYGVTHQQMQENEVNLGLLYDLIANIRYMAYKSKTIWDSSWLPTSFFKRGRAVSAHMHDRCDRIVTSIFGRGRSWWDKASSHDDDYDPFGTARKKDAKGMERDIADQEIARREAELIRRRPSIQTYTTAQDHPGLTYDTELLPESERVMSGERYDRLVAMEAAASRMRYETEKSVQAKRGDLLVPLRKADPTATETPGQATAQPM